MATLLTTLLIVIGGLLFLIWMGQRSMMYFPARVVPSPAAAGLSNVEPVTFTTEDGITLHGWFLPARRSPAWFTVLVCNGNAGNRAYRAALGEAFRAHGLAVLLFDYRGYGGNAGSPTEEGLAQDARAARAYLLGRRDVDATRVVYFGESLGSGVATRLAAEHAPAALIVRSPFASMAEVGQHHYPLLPVRALLRDRYASADRLRQIRCPVLVIAGSRDGVIPIEHSRRYYAAASDPKTLEIIEGADHNDEELFSGDQMIRAIVGFLEAAEQTTRR